MELPWKKPRQGGEEVRGGDADIRSLVLGSASDVVVVCKVRRLLAFRIFEGSVAYASRTSEVG